MVLSWTLGWSQSFVCLTVIYGAPAVCQALSRHWGHCSDGQVTVLICPVPPPCRFLPLECFWTDFGLPFFVVLWNPETTLNTLHRNGLSAFDPGLWLIHVSVPSQDPKFMTTVREWAQPAVSGSLDTLSESCHSLQIVALNRRGSLAPWEPGGSHVSSL